MPPMQLSSTPLQISAGGVHVAGKLHADPQTRLPTVSQVVMHVSTSPRTHAKPSSAPPMQLSSMPLHTSPGGTHVPGVQSPRQVCMPIVSQLVMHDDTSPAAHVNPL